MKTLSQKIRNNKRIFTIQEDGVLVDINNLGNIQKYKVNYDEIRKDEYVHIQSAHALVWLFIISGLFNVILFTALLTETFGWLNSYGQWVLFGGLFIFSLVVVAFKEHFQRVDLKSLDANKALSFVYTKKQRKAVDDFILQIKKAQEQYFKDKYFKIDPVIPIDIQKTRLLWLYDNQYINESEYRVVMEELEQRWLANGDLGVQ